MSYQTILVEQAQRIATITLNRPEVLNALNDQLINELLHALQAYDANPDINVIILKGNEKAFAAGADVAAMVNLDFASAYNQNFIGRNWDAIRQIRKPLIASVAGYALGGGCELMQMCDIIIAAETAQFGQPEIKLAVLPGAGGTQHLPRNIGKAKAMDWCLTGRLISAQEAEQAGLISRVVPLAELDVITNTIAKQLAAQSLPALMMIKEAILAAENNTLNSGIQLERKLFHAAFSLKDQKEGMNAFLEKRKPNFQHQ